LTKRHLNIWLAKPNIPGICPVKFIGDIVIKRLLFAFLIFSYTSLTAGTLVLNSIKTTILLQKDRTPVNINLSLVLKGRDIEENRAKIMDVIQTAVGSFWGEKLITAQGKEQFKKMVINLADKVYGVEIDFVFIQNILMDINRFQEYKKPLNSQPLSR